MFLESDSSSTPGNKDTSPYEDEGMLQRLYPNPPLARNKHSSSSETSVHKDKLCYC